MLLNIGLNLVDTVFCSIWRFLGCQRSDVASYQGDCVKEKYALADEAFVTLATDDSYSLGALVLGHSLRIVQTSRSLVILVTAGVTADMRSQLASVFDLVQEVDEIDSEDEANLAILTRPELGVTFTKIQCWKLTQFKKCVFLDADTLVLRNCDELFNREELSAVPDIGWPDCFNSGVFVFKPSDEMYKALVAFAKEKGSFDGDVFCGRGYYCPDRTTCCPHTEVAFTCCQAENAVCCGDETFCCLSGFVCDYPNQSCRPQSYEALFSRVRISPAIQ